MNHSSSHGAPRPEHDTFYQHSKADPPTAYPHALTRGSHDLTILALIGSAALATVNGDTHHVIADLGELKGRRLTPADVSSPVSSAQGLLF